MNVPLEILSFVHHTVMLGMVSILSDLERGTSKGKGKREAKNGRQRAGGPSTLMETAYLVGWRYKSKAFGPSPRELHKRACNSLI